MSRQELYSFSKTYWYRIEVPYDGAEADGIEGADTVYGNVTWSADIIWSDSGEQYEMEMYWDDDSNHFSHDGEGPMEDEFLDDVYAYMQSQGVNSEDITY